MEKLIIVGLGINAKNAYEFIKRHNLYEVIGFAVNREYKTIDSFYNLPVYSLETIKQDLNNINFKIFISVFWNHLNADRKKIYEFCKKEELEFANLISPKAILNGEIIGENCWISDFAIIKKGALIESNTFIMEYAFVGINTHIASNCFLAARSTVAGECTVGEQSFIGLSATVLDATHIGKKCIIGACSMIKRNIPDFSRCNISYENVIIKQYDECIIEEKLVSSKNIR